MSHDLYMFLAILSMFMTVAFTLYHPLPPTEVPPVLQLFFMFLVHCYRLLHSAVRFLAKRPALFLCQIVNPHVLPLFASAYILSPRCHTTFRRSLHCITISYYHTYIDH
jgi:hypothetical protein